MRQKSELLLRRLEEKGLNRDNISHFMRCTMGILHFTSDGDMDQLNKRLHVAGWRDIDLDYDTVQLMEETLKAGDSNLRQSVSILFVA